MTNTININVAGKEYQIGRATGKVLLIEKSSRTSIRGGGSEYVSISSTTTDKTDIYIDNIYTGKEFRLTIYDWSISLREGHEVDAFFTESFDNDFKPIAIRNRTMEITCWSPKFSYKSLGVRILITTVFLPINLWVITRLPYMLWGQSSILNLFIPVVSFFIYKALINKSKQTEKAVNQIKNKVKQIIEQGD